MPNNIGKVGVFFGGSSAEREISIMSGTAVVESLRKQAFEVVEFDPACLDFESLCKKEIQKVFIALHGKGGEDGTIQGALNLFNIPYTGSGVGASALAINKWQTKLVWRSLGLPTPQSLIIDKDSDFDQIVSYVGLPMVIKPNSEGSTIGLSKVERVEQIRIALERAAQYDKLILAEKWIEGTELTGTIVAGEVYPLVEIQPPFGNYDYKAKYFSDETKYYCPSSFSPEREEELKKLCLSAFNALGCSGWGRVDLIVDAKGRPWLLEVNTVPGLTSHSLVPKAAAALDVNFDQLIKLILESASVE